MSLDRHSRCQLTVDRVVDALSNTTQINDPDIDILRQVALNWVTVFAYKHGLMISAFQLRAATLNQKADEETVVRRITGDRP